MALFLATSPATGVASTTLTQQEQIKKLCQENWEPRCEEYGFPKPNQQPNALACALAWRPGCPGEAETVQGLVRSGPSGLTYPTPGRFSVEGFVQTGWPIVIKYQVPAGATPRLEIKPRFGGGRPVDVRLPPSIDGSPQLYTFRAEVPGSSGKVVVADYSITARDRAGAAIPVNILGIGAGPRAVGSIAIDQIRADPPAVQRPMGNNYTELIFSYLLENAWDRVSEDLWRDCGRKIFCNWSHPSNPYRSAGPGPHTWRWKVTRRAKVGQYNLVIRAWHTCGVQVDVNSYHQCGEQLDWVVGSAGPIFIR